MNNNYTIGPWMTWESTDHKIEILAHQKLICKVLVHPTDKYLAEVDRADAQLIAAAPAMLLELLKTRERMLKAGIHYDNADIYNGISAIIDLAIKPII